VPVSQTAQKGGSMNKDFENELEDDLLPNYDFANMPGGVKGKYVDRYRSGTNIVLLDPDVADAFPTAESVNEALRMLLTIAQRQKQTVLVE
jgi:hypothetical protein